MARPANPNGTETEKMKSLRVPKPLHEAMLRAGQPYGFSTQRVLTLVLTELFGGNPASMKKNVEAHLNNAVQSLSKGKK